MVNRRGNTKLGCLVSLLLGVTVVYFGVGIGEVYFRSYRFQDEMHQQARFAHQIPDTTIRRHLRQVADSLGLPDEAGNVRIRRTSRGIDIWAEYQENLELPGFVRVVRFRPTASGTF